MATIPTISSGVAGPLGAIHLPRLWSKLRLSEAGQLPADYPECGAGFDQMVLDGLRIDRDAAVAYVKENKATYNDFETWVVAQRGGSIQQEEIEDMEDKIALVTGASRGIGKAPPVLAAILTLLGHAWCSQWCVRGGCTGCIRSAAGNRPKSLARNRL